MNLLAMDEAQAPALLALEDGSHFRGTAKTLRASGTPCTVTKRMGEGSPNVHDVLAAGGIAFIINTPHGHDSRGDGAVLRAEAVNRGITNVTTLSGATALLQSLAVLRDARSLPVHALQDLQLPEWEKD